MKTKLLPFLFLSLVILFTGFIAQEDKVKELLERFKKIGETAYQEKIHLHTDKPYYAAGDEIWFKAYLINAKNQLPSNKSNLMYVELLTPQNKLYKRIRISLFAGTGWGNFTLTDTLQEGSYRIRAYTNWMRNFDDEFFYDHTFKVGNIRTSQLVAKTNYLFEKTPAGETVTATINYSNIDGTPYSEKEVSYNVESEGKTSDKGQGITDKSGNLTIRLKNNKPGGLLKTSLKIAERTIVDKFIPIINTSSETSLQFFPEGGELVNNIRTKVAFKALGPDGMGKEVSGSIKNENGEEVVKISTLHKGMGTFSFTPIAAHSYSAVIKFADGSEKAYPLPKAKEEGLALTVGRVNGDSISVRVMGNLPFIEKNLNKEYFVVAQSSGNLIYSMKSSLSASGGFMVRLPIADFPTGIAQFTLLDGLMQPMAERLVFINKNDFLSLNITPNKSAYKKREAVELMVNAQTPNKKSIIGSFSVSVIDETKVPVKENEEHTIFSELLLNSDLKGNIEDPNYYFHEVNETKIQALDALMLTQGWRRFTWQNIIAGTEPVLAYKPEKTLALRGRVTNNKKPVPNANLIIYTSSAKGGIAQTKANQAGEFNLDSLIFPDSTKFIIQARSERGKKFVEIEMDDIKKSMVLPKKSTSALTANINSSMVAYLKNSKTQYEELLKYGLTSRTIMLNEVTIVEEKEKPNHPWNLHSSGSADVVIKESELENAVSLEMALQGRVAGLIFQDGEAFFTRNMGNPVQIILDGMQVESDFLSAIHPQEVESIEVLKSGATTAIYGSAGSAGIIVINTKRGDGTFSNAYTPGIISHTPLGLFKRKEFYVPAYDKAETNGNIGDFRSTVYWNPAVITNSEGVAKIKFFNADGTGSYRVVLEGMDFEGHIGRKVIRYNVN